MAEFNPTRGRPRFGQPRQEPCAKMSIAVTQEVFDRLEKFCADDERSKSWCVEKALRMWLESKGY